MLVLAKERLVYLAVPKTASTSIEKALGGRASIVLRDPPGLKHTPARRWRRIVRALLPDVDVNEFETVALIREPIDWLGSWFRYRQRPYLDGHENSTAGMSFNTFVEAYLTETPPPPARIGAQARFLSNQKGELAVHHLFAYERMSDLFAFLENRIGKRLEVGHFNASPRAELSLDPALEQRLRREREADFALHRAALDGLLGGL